MTCIGEGQKCGGRGGESAQHGRSRRVRGTFTACYFRLICGLLSKKRLPGNGFCCWQMSLFCSQTTHWRSETSEPAPTPTLEFRQVSQVHSAVNAPLNLLAGFAQVGRLSWYCADVGSSCGAYPRDDGQSVPWVTQSVGSRSCRLFFSSCLFVLGVKTDQTAFETDQPLRIGGRFPLL